MDTARLQNLPLELRRGRFACWRAEQIREGTWSRVLVNAHTGHDGAFDDPLTWGAFDKAVAYCQAHENDVLGVARVCGGDNPATMAIEFNSCLDEQQHLKPGVATKWLRQFNSYSEVSPSGKGVILWVKATHSLGGHTERSSKEQGVTIYRERQWLPLTGQRLIQFDGIVEYGQPVVNGLYRELFGAEDIRSKPAQPWRQRSSFTREQSPPHARIATPSAQALPGAPTSPPTLKIDEAKEFLEKTLRNGAMEQTRVIAAAIDRNISLRTLRRAKRALRITSTRRTFQGKVLWVGR